MEMQRIVALSSNEIALVSGGEPCNYEQAAAFWEGIAVLGALAGQPEVVAAAAAMVAYNHYMAGKYC